MSTVNWWNGTMRWDVQKDKFALWLKQMLTKIRSIMLLCVSLSISLYVASAFHVWSSRIYFPAAMQCSSPFFPNISVMWHIQKHEHTKRQNKRPSSSAPLSNHLFLPYHTCISQWSQFSVLHPLKPVWIKRLHCRQLCKSGTPWRLIVHFHV